MIYNLYRISEDQGYPIGFNSIQIEVILQYFKIINHRRILTQIQGCFKASAAVILLNGLTVNI